MGVVGWASAGSAGEVWLQPGLVPNRMANRHTNRMVGRITAILSAFNRGKHSSKYDTTISLVAGGLSRFAAAHQAGTNCKLRLLPP